MAIRHVKQQRYRQHILFWFVYLALTRAQHLRQRRSHMSQTLTRSWILTHEKTNHTESLMRSFTRTGKLQTWSLARFSRNYQPLLLTSRVQRIIKLYEVWFVDRPLVSVVPLGRSSVFVSSEVPSLLSSAAIISRFFSASVALTAS